jgi:hypothetical protein
MKSVPLDPKIVEPLGKWVVASLLRHRAVKGRVEACILLCVRQKLLRLANQRHRRRNVNRRELRRSHQLLNQSIVDQLMLAKMRSAMHHSVPNRRRTVVPKPPHKIEDFLERMALRIEGISLIQFRSAGSVLDLQAPIGMANTAGPTRQHQHRIALTLRLIEPELQRRRSAVDRQNEFAATHCGQVQLRISGLSIPQVWAYCTLSVI